MTEFDRQADIILNEFNSSLKTVKREFYPRSLQLSPEFLTAFRLEYQKLNEDGVKNPLDKIIKALKFHV